ncbi:MAG: (Fe-S)-binding protein [Nitriliruptorales bacterium]|nr:(Fe-S)-binding protein [Nitriliruptorales bacterium]
MSPAPDAASPAPDAIAEARHGSFCPKMCSFACPVTAATGRDDAIPWSFHRTLVELVDGALPAGPAAAGRLTACSGCLSCRVPCEFDQDVPAQVREGRARLVEQGHPVAGGDAARSAVDEGRSPFGVARPDMASTSAASTLLIGGCRDDADVVRAAVELLTAAGIDVGVHVPPGCCGAVLDDLGYREEAAALRPTLEGALEGCDQVLLLDPHCHPSVAAAADQDVRVIHLVEELDRLVEAGRLRLRSEPRSLTYHDPCLLARGPGIIDAPRRLLAATGAEVIEPEHTGTTTFCSGAGLALELVDPTAADATATQRRAQLEAAAARSVTACAGAARRLTPEEGNGTSHLIRELADHLEERV